MFPFRDNIPLARFPIVTAVLVALNVLAYLLAIRHGGSFFGGPGDGVEVRYGAIPYELAHPGEQCATVLVRTLEAPAAAVACQGRPGSLHSVSAQPTTWTTPFTSMFLHAGPVQIFANMLVLAIFGPTVEDRVGRLRFALFYVLGGLMALSAQVLADPDSTAPLLGSSGAIAAVLGGYVLLNPRGRILTLVLVPFFFTIVEVPAALLLGLWLAEQICAAATSLAATTGASQGVLYLALAVGFVFGLLALRPLLTRRGDQGRASAGRAFQGWGWRA